MKHTILFHAGLLVLMASTLSGCAYITNYTVSRPTESKGQKRGKITTDINHSLIQYANVDLHIRPLNDINTSRMFLVTIIPVYIGWKDLPEFGCFRSQEPYNRDSEFRILVALLPDESNFNLSAKKTFVSIDGNTFNIAAIEGPVRYNPYVRHLFYTYNPSHGQQLWRVDQGYIFSLLDIEGERRNVGVDNMEFDIPKTGLWSCFELIFNCKTPRPEQDVKLSFGGLMQGDIQVDIPIIEFKESHFSVGDSIP